MRVLLITEDNCVRGSNLTLNVGETLIVVSALRLFVENSEHHQSDKDTARKMIKQLYPMYGIDEG